MFDCCTPLFGMSLSAVSSPDGATAEFTLLVDQIIAQVVPKSSDLTNLFVLFGSINIPFKILGEIGSQSRVVLKHFTPSTFEPWKGAVVSTEVLTYSPTVWIDCPVTSSICIRTT